nr:3-hydroxylacyl-ACP dehydratase [Bosea caraganae]
MILIDGIREWSEHEIRTELTIRPSCPFFVGGKGIAAHIAMEWMAQSCAAFIGVEALRAQQPVKIGFLLGTRNFSAALDWFGEGETLEISARPVYRDAGMGQFDCAVYRPAGKSELAKAQLTVYQPDDLSNLIQDQTSERGT